jgi:phage nucleotide-binding protein
MSIKLKSTKDVAAQGNNFLIYGQAGAGKTTLAKTLPKCLIISAESGLLSLKDSDVSYVEITSMTDLHEAYSFVKDSDFESVMIDSISEIAEVLLAEQKKTLADGRAAYGEMDVQLSESIRAFRDLPIHVVMTAKLEKQTDEMGRVLYFPSLPGNKTAQKLPYFFDEVLALRVEKDEDGVTQRALLTDGDGLWLAKDRSGKLDQWESCDLGEIISKIGGES